MPKAIPSALLADIQSDVLSLATLVTITREDGRTYNITSHDTSITFNGTVYDHTTPFVLSATQTGTDLAVDNNELRLALDDTVFTAIDFIDKRFDNAEITISLVNFNNPANGRMIIRKGWFGPIARQQNGVVKITIVGLLKVVDLSVGRIYQPSCDADLGDKRCKVAIDQGQAYSPINRYYVGDWVYHYDEAAMTAITVVNPSFESETTSVGDPITGWQQSAGAVFQVSDGGTFPNPTDGANALWGEYTGGGGSDRLEQLVFQDIDLVSGGISAADIDDGRISLAYFVDVAQPIALTAPLRLKLEMLNASGRIIQTYDTLAFTLRDIDLFQTRALAGPIIEGSRTARLSIYMYRTTTSLIRSGADNVRLYFWDHTIGNPNHDRIYRCSRVTGFNTTAQPVFPNNASFEAPSTADAAMNDLQNIPSWTKAASSFWGTETSIYGTNATLGTRFLYAGDDTSGTQKTYAISQDKNLVDLGMTISNVLLGFYRGKFNIDVYHGNLDSTARVQLEFMTAANVVQSTVVLMDYDIPLAVGWETLTAQFSVPVLATKVRITLLAKSPALSSEAQIGFDNLKFYFADVSKALSTDPASGVGEATTVFDTATGSYTADGELVWKAKVFHVEYDEVATVTDRKVFTATNAAGVSGVYTTGIMTWLSGANAGQRNLVRLWTPATKEVKMYFPALSDIAPGDRFQLIRSCQKRFTEDCVLSFDNGINFRGFPYLPGRA